MRNWVVWVSGALCLMAGCAGTEKGASVTSNREREIRALLSKMTLEEKVGQMTQITWEMVARRGTDGSLRIDDQRLREALLKYHVGSILAGAGRSEAPRTWHTMITRIQDLAANEARLRIPVICGIDAAADRQFIRGATFFPQPIALSASGNRELVRRCAKVTARETRAAGIPWRLSPILGLARQPLWPRFAETYGEDSHLVSVLGRECIRGLQGGKLSDFGAVAGAMKYFPGGGAPGSGGDQAWASMTEAQLRELYLPPFTAAVQAGVLTALASAADINGRPVHGNASYLQAVLRGELGFQGILVSDRDGINNLFAQAKVVSDQRAAVKMAVMAGIDMICAYRDYSLHTQLLNLVRSQEVPEQRVDEAVTRILRVKHRLGLFETPYPEQDLADQWDSEESAALNYQAACAGLTLLKNERQLLPLSPETRVLVTGPCAHRLSALTGVQPAGPGGDPEALHPPEKDSIWEAIEKRLGPDLVSFVDKIPETAVDLETLMQKAGAVDVVIVCLGEPSYAETASNTPDLRLSQAQTKLVSALARTGKALVGVLVQGRPRVIDQIEGKLDAIVLAYRPGIEGGRALADALFGTVNPSGRLPFSYPRQLSAHICYDHSFSEAAGFNPQWEFGHGLSYTQFAYRGLRLDKGELTEGDSVKLTVEVVNTGERAGKEIVQVFLTDHVASVTPPVRQLKGFTQVELDPGQSDYVSITLDWDDFALIGPEHRSIVEPGKFTVSVGGLSQTITAL